MCRQRKEQRNLTLILTVFLSFILSSCSLVLNTSTEKLDGLTSADPESGNNPTEPEAPFLWTDRSLLFGEEFNANLQDVAVGPSGQILVAGNGFLQLSRDAGESWSDLYQALGLGINVPVTGVAISADGQRMIVGGWSGTLFISYDYGESWQSRSAAAGVAGTNVFRVAIGPSGEFGIVGVNGLVKTSADGETWNDRKAAAGTGTTSIESIAFNSHGDIFIIGANGFIRRFMDGSWDNLSTNIGSITTRLRSVRVDIRDSIYITGFESVALVSDDDGETWQSLSDSFVAPGRTFWRIGISQDGVISLVGNDIANPASEHLNPTDAFIRISYDGGFTWHDQTPDMNFPVGYAIRGVSIGADGLIAIVGSDGFIFTNQLE
jgi:photosystem II stability/assembly factor-like uncharacterized protein